MKPDGPSEIVQLRQVLSERFPHLRVWSEEAAAKAPAFWPTEVSQLDGLLNGGLPKGAITEIVSEKSGAGSAVLLRALLRQAQRRMQPAGLIDASDSFDVMTMEPAVLAQLLWVRCHTAEEAIKAADILLRDRNLSLVALDLKMNAAAQLRKISATAWYRLQRILQQTGGSFVVLTPWAMAPSAEARLQLTGQFTLADLARNEGEILAGLKFELTRWTLADRRGESMAAQTA